MECLGLHNKPKAEVRPGHKLTGRKGGGGGGGGGEEEEEEGEEEEEEGGGEEEEEPYVLQVLLHHFTFVINFYTYADTKLNPNLFSTFDNVQTDGRTFLHFSYSCKQNGILFSSVHHLPRSTE
jgi:hypothetical protein